MAVRISGVEKGSICDKKIHGGDTLLSVNGFDIRDVLDYRFYTSDEKLRLLIETESGKRRTVKIKKGEYDDLGLVFDTYLMDKHHACKNKCIFCFIDQMPEGMRESLYFKDDDSRLSFLFGNYVTLTNLTDEDIDRIIKMHISPVNVSVHTMNPELRVQMMKNPHAGSSLRYLSRLAKAGIKLNTQLVLCPGINDGKELQYSLDELGKLYPAVQSIAAVPVGLTKYRDNLPPLEPFDKKTSAAVIDAIDDFNIHFQYYHGETIAYAADEFYLKADRPIPPEEYYGSFPQLENGVGMWRSLENEFTQALNTCETAAIAPRHVSVATGTAAYPLLQSLADAATDRVKGLTVSVFEIQNNFFGASVTVSGLLTGRDLAEQLSGKDLGDALLISENMLRSGEDVFLDDMTVPELSERLGVPIHANRVDGFDLLEKMIGK
ncbi:MAG: DUF512 domain-containing protein [Clostridia bacterium]|nr:DUF512 domain-containing protein [Clostridia bacterium]